jgi:CHAD domain-containing protein
MATVTSLPGASPSNEEQRGLSYSMARVLSELENFRELARHSARNSAPEITPHGSRAFSPDSANPPSHEAAPAQPPANEEAVHDLRVSIRRCRSIASVMEEVDPDLAWPEMRRDAKKLFKSLGGLRDAQVLEEWVKKLAPADDPITAQMRANFAKHEPQLFAEALRAARKFEERDWKRLARTLRRRIRLVPEGGLAAECLAFERFEDAKAQHARALRTENSTTWHMLRITVKRFRYTVENFLPLQHASWSENLKLIQDLLGDIHDLDVLSDHIARVNVTDPKTDAAMTRAARRTWHEVIHRERTARVEKYRHLMLGDASLWSVWRHALPHGERLLEASVARLRATSQAADPHRSSTNRNARFARLLFDSLRRAKAGSVFADARARQLLTSAAILQNVSADNSRKAREAKSPHKSAHKFLSALAVPPGLSQEDWYALLAAVRYHRGAEPEEGDSVFSKLSADQKQTVRVLAGVLRLAGALSKSGAEIKSRLRADNTKEAVLLRIPNLPDDLASAKRLAAAKHLLEIYLTKPLVLCPAPTLPKPPTSPAPETNLLQFVSTLD